MKEKIDTFLIFNKTSLVF